MRGIRGATTVPQNTKEDIFAAAQEMVKEMCRCNSLAPEDIGAAIFSATEDITAAFPAAGVRLLPGFDLVPLFDARQMSVDGSLPMCLRGLLLADTAKKQNEIQHVYLRGAVVLRPDLLKDH